MKKRLLAIGLALGLLTVTVPVSMANHFSVGTQDTVGTSAQEEEGSPSVEGTVVGADDTPYGVGTKAPSECYDADAEISQEEATEAATSHGFCSQLWYNNNTTWAEASPPDQDYPTDFVTQFDVQHVYYVGYLGLVPCQPMCDDGDGIGVQNATWNATHDTGAMVGLTEDSETAHQNNEGDREILINHRANVYHAPGILQRETDAWEMNGFQAPSALETFVGFLEGDDGPISELELQEHVNALKDSGQISDETTPQVCGYTPNFDFVSTGEQTVCATPMTYVGANESAENHGDAMFGSYNDPCQSPTYFCAPTQGPHWESNNIGLAGAYGGSTQTNHVIWHWVVAPNDRECGNTQPGFAFNGDGTGTPYLAHDVDVFTPPTDLSDAPQNSPDHTLDYTFEVVNDLLDVPDLPPLVQDTVDDALDTTFDAVNSANDEVTPDDLLEPNHLGAESYVIDDNSRSEVEAEYTLTECEELAVAESQDTADPWVNIVDNGVDRIRETGVTSAWVGLSVTAGPYGDYGAQDSANDGNSDLYSTDGFTGIFSDHNDDGDYDRITGFGDSLVFGSPVYQDSAIYETGAYPMLWDMHVNETSEDPEIDPTEGCEAFPDEPFAKTMKNAGYGPNTGIAQAIYLKEGTVFTTATSNPDDPQVEQYDNGNNIYVLLNQAGRELWDGELDDGTDDAPLSEEIDTLVEELSAYVQAEHGVAEPGVEQPGDVMGLDSDFGSQCGESTGGYSSQLSFVHNCELDCDGDTIATMYAFEVTNADGSIGGGEIPYFKVSDQRYDFGTGVHSWFDIDAFDGDETRDEERKDPPPTGDD